MSRYTFISGYVYAIKDESNRYKLGKSENVLQRLMELQTGNAERLTIAHTLKVLDIDKAEVSLHELFASGRIRSDGEWFRIENIDLFKKVFRATDTTEREEKLLESLGLR